jgi:hypothetical protein
MIHDIEVISLEYPNKIIFKWNSCDKVETGTNTIAFWKSVDNGGVIVKIFPIDKLIFSFIDNSATSGE